VIVVPWAQGGAKGWFRSMAIPRRWAVKPWGVAPVGITVARMPCGAWGGGCYLPWAFVAPAALYGACRGILFCYGIEINSI